jgi:hypothetical protein
VRESGSRKEEKQKWFDLRMTCKLHVVQQLGPGSKGVAAAPGTSYWWAESKVGLHLHQFLLFSSYPTSYCTSLAVFFSFLTKQD